MARYIDADKFEKRLRASPAFENMGQDGYFLRDVVLDILEKQTTADVAEVVRCKDCKCCELRYPAKAINEEAIEGYYCSPNQRYVKSTDFCGYAERRTPQKEG